MSIGSLQALLLVISLSTITVLTGCDADVQRAIDAALSEAKGQVQNLQASDDSRIINGDFNYDWTVSFSVKNVGKSGHYHRFTMDILF